MPGGGSLDRFLVSTSILFEMFAITLEELRHVLIYHYAASLPCTFYYFVSRKLKITLNTNSNEPVEQSN